MNTFLHSKLETHGNKARQSEIGWPISRNYYPVEQTNLKVKVTRKKALGLEKATSFRNSRQCCP